METSEHAAELRRLRFKPALEQVFREDHYHKLLPGLRGGLIVLVIVHVLLAILSGVVTGVIGSPLLFAIGGVFLLGLSFHPHFEKIWQPATVAIFCGLFLLIVLFPSSPTDQQLQPIDQLLVRLRPGIPIIVYGFVLTRLHFRWFLPATLLVFLTSIAVGVQATQLPFLSVLPQTLRTIGSPLMALIYVNYILERSARSEFLANHQLEAERNDERRQRERTEGKLQVLGQAIGGIVHDLGNPLTVVQSGTSTLQMLIEDEDVDRETLEEFSGMIADGAQMLNYLRLSLIEQTRVLEGRPIPLEIHPVALRPLIETGARFQKPRNVSGREINIEGPEMELCLDEKKMVTVFMNLIGNALKYSDGKVCVSWRQHENTILIAVLDEGLNDKGITPSQAEQLFTAFGRLDTHAEIEGTGLGLLSVQKIMQAHDGEVFIEGFADGTPASPPFSTAGSTPPSMLSADFRTAFVIACPLEVSAGNA